MREYTLIDAHGNSFVPLHNDDPESVWMRGVDQEDGWVPWTLARWYPEDATVDEIVNDLKSDSEVTA